MGELAANPAEPLVERATQRPAQPAALVLLIALGVAAFAGAAASAIAFTDVAGAVRWTALAATSLFLVSVISYTLSRSPRAAAVAAALAVLACAGALHVAVEAQREHDRLRGHYAAGRPGPAITLLSGAQTSHLARHVLTSVAGWTAAITGVPLAAYFALRAFREAPEPRRWPGDDDDADDPPR